MHDFDAIASLLSEVLYYIDHSRVDPRGKISESLPDVLTNPITAQMLDVMVDKGHDYSGAEEHTWVSFELESFLSQLTLNQVFIHDIAEKVARLNNIRKAAREVKDFKPNFESESESWLDLANYLVLFIGYHDFRWSTSPDVGNNREISPAFDGVPLSTLLRSLMGLPLNWLKPDEHRLTHRLPWIWLISDIVHYLNERA